MTAFSFNAATVTPSTGPEAIPAGWYHAKITDAEIKPTADGTGTRLNLKFEILAGQFVGRKVFTGLNIKNSNAQAQEIAYHDLSAIQHAIGRIQINDTNELLGVPLNIKVKVRGERKDPVTGDTYEASNDITTYKAYDPNIPQAGGASPSAVTGQPVAPSGFGVAGSAPVAAPPGFGAPGVAAAGAQPWAQPPAQQPWQGSPAAQAPQAVASAPQQTPPPGFAAPAPVAAPAQTVLPNGMTPEAMMAQMAAMQAALNAQAAQAAPVVNVAPQAPAAPAVAAAVAEVATTAGAVPPWAQTPPAAQ